MELESKTDQELCQIAEDLFKGKIFCDRHLKDEQDFKSVFLVFFFMKSEDIEEIKNSKPGLFYEYLDQRGPLSMNGMPQFFSMKMLNMDDTNKMFEKYDAIKNAVEGIKNDSLRN